VRDVTNGDTRLLVDGNNVMGAAADGWWRDPPAAVQRQLARQQCYARTTDAHVELVFDVRQPDLAEGEQRGVVVRYATRRGRDAADDRIVDLLGDDAPGTEVVTSDRALRDRVERRGARVVGAKTFLTRLADAGC
jgi:predicted RNA-binding protein with PIN domain